LIYYGAQFGGVALTLLLFIGNLPIVKLYVKRPDGTESKYTIEKLRESFLSGEVTQDCVARRKDESDYRPVTEILYPPNKT
jgi:hypothetical protein